MDESRTNKIARNVKYMLIEHVITCLVTFIGRSVFIYCLNKEYLGVSGLFSNILSMLTLAELGIGVAMNYFLYKPLANHDEKGISAYMNFYASAYRAIGCFVILVGAALTPFLPYIIQEETEIKHLALIYLLYVLNSGVSYFFSYKRTLFIADQNGYEDVLNTMYTNIVKTILQCAILLLTRDFILYLLVQIGTVLFFNILISRKADRVYPFLKQYRNQRLGKGERRELFRYVGATMSHKVGAVVISGTDNILITLFDSIIKTGLYSNYYLVIASLNKVIFQVYSALTASIGNLNVVSEIEHKRTVFSRCFFVNNWITCFCSVCLWCLFQPFVSLWAGADYLLGLPVVFIIVLDFYLRCMNHPVHSFKSADGLFWNDRYRPVVEAVINLTVSIVLGRKLGILGVLWGTAISMLLTRFWIEPYVLFKHTLKQSGLRYFLEYGKFMLLTAILAYATNALVILLPTGNLFSFAVQCVICIIVPNAIMLALFWRKPEFRYVLGLVQQKLRGKGQQ